MNSRQATFEQLWNDWDWVEISDCPGRYRLTAGRDIPPEVLAGANAAAAREYRVAAARNPVIVIAIEGGGLVSYRHSGGTYLHTLNTPSGFSRKLRQLGIRN